MSDFFSSTTGLVITIITLFSVLICGVFLKVQASKKLKVSLDAETNSTGHVWDEDLKELNNPMPMWWMGLFYITIVFGLSYFYFFPGLGTYEGKSEWSSAAQHAAEKAALEAKAAPLYAKYDAMPVENIGFDPDGHAMGERLFLNNCAQCHGSDARGSVGFPNLTDADWLYGGEGETIVASIRDGRHGMMPPMKDAVGGSDNARAVAQYVLSLSGRENDSLKAQLGRKIFQDNCVACHGADGAGSKFVGAPNLTDRVWLYGGSERVIVETIMNGRQGQMPSHEKLLTPQQVRVLAGYVYSLSNDKPKGEKVAQNEK